MAGTNLNTPVTPRKRKTTDTHHAARASVEQSPFKHTKLDHELSIQVKRCSGTENAATRRLDGKIDDPKTARPAPGGFELRYSADGFGGYSMGLSATTFIVPSMLAKHLREQAMHAANNGSTKQGKTPTDRASNRVKQLMTMMAKKGSVYLLNMTSDEENRILRKGSYTCLGHALKNQPFLLGDMSSYESWDPEATTYQQKPDGQSRFILKDDSGRPIVEMSMKEVYVV